MPIPTADPTAERIEQDLARKIARSLNDKQANQLRAIYERDQSSDGGWTDMRVNDGLHRRGLVTYIRGPRSHPQGGKTRTVTDVKPTFAGVQVLEEWEVLHAPGGYSGSELGYVQKYALQCLVDNNGGQWWAGCGWSMEGGFETIRILDTLVARGLAERGATGAGATMFTATRMGRMEARPHWRKLLDVRNAREDRMGKQAAQALGSRRPRPEPGKDAAKAPAEDQGHGYTWGDVREVDARQELHLNDTFIKPGRGAVYSVRADGSVRPEGITWTAPLDGIAWTVKDRSGESFTCESHTGRIHTEALPTGARVLKVIPKQKDASR